MRISVVINHMVCLFLGIISFANADWEVAGPNGSLSIRKFVKIGNTFFVRCYGVYRSDDCGRNWHLIDNSNRYEIYDMIANDSCLFLNVKNDESGGIWIRSKNKGDTWEQCNTAPGENLSASGNMLFKIGTGNRAAFSYDYGDTWNYSDSSIRGQVKDFAFMNESLFACTDNGVFVSMDRGNSWVKNTSTPGSKLYLCGNKLFLGIGGHDVVMFDGKTSEWKSFSYEIKDNYPNPISGDNDKCYIACYSGIIKLYDTVITKINFKSCIYCDPTIQLCDSTILLGTDGAGIFRSDNDGQTWESSNNGIIEAPITSMVCNKGMLYASTYNKVFQSANNGDTWSILGGGLPLIGGGQHYNAINSIAIVNDTLFAGINPDRTDTSSGCHSPFGLLKYSESTNQWVRAFDSLEMAQNLYNVTNILVYKNFKIYVHFAGITRYDTTNKEWSKCDFISTKEDVVCYIKDSLFFVANNYDVEGTIINTYYEASDISAINLNYNCKPYYPKSFTKGVVHSFTSIGDIIFAEGTYDHKQFFLKSIDTGKTWIELPIPYKPIDKNIFINCLGSYKNILLVSLGVDGFCFSADTGETWSKIPTTQMFSSIKFFTYNDKYLFAAGNRGIWRLPLTELENTHTRFQVRTDRYLKNYQIKNDKLYLYLNFPNVENVSISMYNLQGKLIDKMVYNKLTQGKHEIVLKNKNLTSSCSIIKIKVGSDTKCLPVHYFR